MKTLALAFGLLGIPVLSWAQAAGGAEFNQAVLRAIKRMPVGGKYATTAQAKDLLARAVVCDPSETIRTSAGFEARKSSMYSSDTTTMTVSRLALTASSASSGPATTSTPDCCRSHATSAGALSMPTTGMVTSSTSRWRSARLLIMNPTISGPSSDPKRTE